MEQYKINLLKLVAEHELTDYIKWNIDLEFYVTCSDFFFWGCADAENITSQEDVDLFELAIKDVRSLLSLNEVCTYEYATELYCAKKRKMRPQGACYEFIPKHLWSLFDACGPEREVDIVNPKPRPTE
jgi:hypothetical protein